MTSRKTTLLWSPHSSDCFAIGSPEHLKMYRFAPRFAGNREMHLLGGITDVQQLKCMAWSPQHTQPWTFAVGTASGRVVLHDCTPTALRNDGATATASALCEFTPRFSRVCFSVAWSPLNTHHVAAGLDKVRSDFGVLVWDVTRAGAASGANAGSADGTAECTNADSSIPVSGSSSSSGASRSVPRRQGNEGLRGGNTAAAAPTSVAAGGANNPASKAGHGSLGIPGHALPAPSAAKGSSCNARRGSDFSTCMSFDLSAVGAVPTIEEPVAQLGNSEAATSIGWAGSPSCLLVGTGFRWLRMYDLRAREASAGSPVLSCHAHAKAVCGVSIDPFNEHRVVTYSDEADGIIKGWDVRQLRDNAPLFTIATSGKGAPQSIADTQHFRGGGSRSVLHVAWCPTRSGLLSTVMEGSQTIYVWDVNQAVARHLESSGTAAGGLAAASGTASQDTRSGSNNSRPTGTGVRLTTFESAYDCESALAAAAWHPTDHSRLLMLLRSGTDVTLRDLSLHQAPPIAWSVLGPLLHVTKQQDLVVVQPSPAATRLAADATSGDSESPVGDRSAIDDSAASTDPVAWVRAPLSPHQGEVAFHVSSTDSPEAPKGISGLRPSATAGIPMAPTIEIEGGTPSADTTAAPSATQHAEDVVSCMHERALAGYAVDPHINLEILEQRWAATSPVDQTQLASAWRWVLLASESSINHLDEKAGSKVSVVARGAPSDGTNAQFARHSNAPKATTSNDLTSGALAMLKPSGEASSASSGAEASGTHSVVVSDYSRSRTSGLQVFHSTGRSRLARSFGWEICTDPARLESVISTLEKEGKFERAALMALFQSGAHPHYNELGRAVRSLEHGGAATGGAITSDRTSALRMMALVLAGYQANAPLWWSTVHATAASLSSPHLRLLLAVLCSPSEAGVHMDGALGSDHSGSEDGADSAEDSASHRNTSNDAEPNLPSRKTIGVTISDHQDPGRLNAPYHGDSSIMLQQVVLQAGSARGIANGHADSEIFSDALAMACRFLPDSKLHSLLRQLINRAVHAGTLGALSITGLSVAAVPLLQSYIDRTGDIQSAVLLCSKGPSELIQHPRAQAWVAIYSRLLNSWQLYHLRCKLTIALARQTSSDAPSTTPNRPSDRPTGGGGTQFNRSSDRLPNVPPSRSTERLGFQEQHSQVFARCAFCSHSLVTNGGGRAHGVAGRQSRTTPKATACPRCKKPLPRCSVCQQHLGCPDPAEATLAADAAGDTPSDVPRGAEDSSSTWDSLSSSFDNWMVWCQTCRHGGHAAHLLEWFEHHDECPVAGCSCRCATRDVKFGQRYPQRLNKPASPNCRSW